MKKLAFYDDVYGVQFVAFANITATALKVEIEKRFQPMVVPDDFEGVCINGSNYIIIAFGNKADTKDLINTVSHECMHAVFDVMNKRGVDYSTTGNNEAYTYYMGYLNNKILPFVQRAYKVRK